MDAALGTILVVDDNPQNLRVLSELLSAEGFRVRVANSGERALAAVDAALPDLILLDVSMPGMDGFMCCATLKRSPITAPVPVIFLTAHTDTDHIVQGFSSGGVDYVTKPFREPELLARVRTHLELRRCQLLLESMSLKDGLTGIANRRRFDQVLEQEWRRASHSGRPLALVLADVDHFKAYNDGHGHAAGDACLRAVASAFASAFQRPGDLAARYGGEEFAAILPETADAALELAERARAAVADLRLPHGRGAGGAYVSLSLGVASTQCDGRTSSVGLIEAADGALYAAKRVGRNRIEAAAGTATAGAQPQH